jgi:ribosomal protein L11 methyltransferase
VAVANILADVIIPLTGVIRPFLKDGGIFISSGILSEKADDVRAALNKHHFTILEENTLGEWVSFVAQKKQS